MGRKQRNNFSDSAWNDRSSVDFYYENFTNLAISSFRWNNLPDTIDQRWLEVLLFTQGACVFFQDDILGFLCLAMAANGNLNVYNIPTKFRAVGNNGYNKQLTLDDAVIIYNNEMHTNSDFIIRKMCKRIWEYDCIIDINVKAQKTPILLQCGEDQRQTLINLYQRYDGNSPVIKADKNFDIRQLNVLKTDAPFVAPQLYELKTDIYNEALTYLGISNIAVNKRERLIKDEVNRTMGGVLANRQVRLGTRQRAAEQINRMFGLDISVDFVEYNIDQLLDTGSDQLPLDPDGEQTMNHIIRYM